MGKMDCGTCAGEETGRSASPARAREAPLSLSALVSWWDGDRGAHAPETELWGGILRAQALDLGLRSAWEMLPRDGTPCPLSRLDQMLSILARRGIDAGQCYLSFESGGGADLWMMAPKAFPGLGIMSDPDPGKVGLLR